jgi:hypothetical protein
MKKYKPFQFLYLDKHAAWLAEMARQGWYSKRQDLFGFQHFEQGEPAGMAFCWDLAPRAQENLLVYRQRCREAGWEIASTSGRWTCWSKVMVPGEPVQPVRDKASTLAMLLTRQRELSLRFMVMAIILLPNVFSKGRPLWLNLVMTASLVGVAIASMREALYAKIRARQLG